VGGNGDWEAAHSQPEYVTPRAQNGGKLVNETVKNGGNPVNTTTENGGKQRARAAQKKVGIT